MVLPQENQRENKRKASTVESPLCIPHQTPALRCRVKHSCEQRGREFRVRREQDRSEGAASYTLGVHCTFYSKKHGKALSSKEDAKSRGTREQCTEHTARRSTASTMAVLTQGNTLRWNEPKVYHKIRSALNHASFPRVSSGGPVTDPRPLPWGGGTGPGRDREQPAAIRGQGRKGHLYERGVFCHLS